MRRRGQPRHGGQRPNHGRPFSFARDKVDGCGAKPPIARLVTVPRVGPSREASTVSENYTALIRRMALAYIDSYGDAAVEIIRAECVAAHKDGRQASFRIWRDVGVAADDLLMSLSHEPR